MELLERDSFLHELDAALNESVKGLGRIVLVSGEAGIGKTSLVEHFTRAHSSSIRVLWGACDSLFTPRPLGPLFDIAVQLEGELPALLNSNADRQAIFSACLAELQNRPTILVFEDIHWADEATLDLIKFLGRRIQRTAALFILTYRDDELGAEHPLRLVLGDLPSHRLRLFPLSKSSVFALASAENQAARAYELFEITNGNPFFVTEALASKGEGIPATVRDAVLARAARLSPAARAVLEAAAVIGSRVEPWLLADVVGTESANIEECIAKGMLQSQGDHYVFRHELARQTILESIPPGRKIALHRTTLNALKESPKTRNELARLVNHAEGTKDAQAVLECAPSAARQASAASSHREAAAQYARALRFADLLPQDQRAQLFENQSYELWLNGRVEDAVRAQKDALTLWRQLDRQDKVGNCLRFLSQLTMFAGKIADARTYISEAVETLEKLPPGPELANVYSTNARIHMILWEEDQALHWGTRAIELAETLGATEILINALNTVGNIEQDSQPEIGQLKLKRSLDLALEYKLHEDVVRAYGNLGRGEYDRRRYASALNYDTEGFEYAKKHDLDMLIFSTKTAKARVYFEQGRWVDAIAEASEALHSNRVYLIAQADALDVLSRIQVRQGNTVSQETLETLRKFANDNPVGEGFRIPALFAEMAWLQDDLARCREEAESMFQIVCHLNSKREIGELAYWLWRAGAITEAPVNAEEPYAAQIAGHWKTAASMWEKFGCPYEQGMALMDGDEAAQMAALEIFEHLGARPVMELLKQKMRSQGIRVPRGPRPTTREHPFGFTDRELEVLSCLVEGSTNRAIARKLNISNRTAEHHIASILRKMGVPSRADAVALAVKNNLLPSR
jgi:ATP/maltotriose-dependent transcriptional regulator MalT